MMQADLARFISLLAVPFTLHDQLHVGGFKRVTEAATRDWLSEQLTRFRYKGHECAVEVECETGVVADGSPGRGRADIVVTAATLETTVIELKVHSLAALSDSREDLEWRVEYGLEDWTFIGAAFMLQQEMYPRTVDASWATYRVRGSGFKFVPVSSIVQDACYQVVGYADDISASRKRPVDALAVVVLGFDIFVYNAYNCTV
jgi:hypothetical protein